MSLDFYLMDGEEEVFHRNITHNLGKMATAAGLYEVLWRPNEYGFVSAHQCISELEKGLVWLIKHYDEATKYNAPNGWGTYFPFLKFVIAVYEACRTYPYTTVYVSR